MNIFDLEYKIFENEKLYYLRSKGNDSFVYFVENEIYCIVENSNTQRKLDKLGLVGSEIYTNIYKYIIPEYKKDKVFKLLKLVKK